MNDAFAGVAALLALLVVLLVAALRRLSSDARRAPLYLDDGPASATFVSRRYRLRARPDLLERDGDTVTLVELKSRARGVHPSDRAQVVATALAVRAAGHDVRRARIETREGAPVAVDLDASDEALFERIRPIVRMARLAVAGTPPAPTPSAGKCRACGYRANCPHRGDTR